MKRTVFWGYNAVQSGKVYRRLGGMYGYYEEYELRGV
jgi:hypothetical protein